MSKNNRRRIGASCILTHDGCVLLGWSNKRKGWEFPGGRQEGKETVEETVAREVCEETDISIGPGPCAFVTHCQDADDWLNMVFHLELANYAETAPSHEHREFQWFPLKWLPSPLSSIAETVVQTDEYTDLTERLVGGR